MADHGSRTIVPLNNGNGIKWLRFVLAYNDPLVAVAAASATITLFTLPANAIVLATRTKHSVAFAGTSITDMSFVVGISGTTNMFATDLDVDAAVAATTLVQLGIPTAAVTAAAIDVIATIGSTGANLSALTAGSVTVDMLIAVPGE